MTYIEAGKALIKKIEESGYEAYFVGGAVRDELLNIPINDVDITTSAKSDELMEIFPNVNKKGLKYHSVLINFLGYEFETTTYRVDLEYTDNRHPIVSSAKNILVDLARRDFSINALATKDFTEILDEYDGINDLNKHLVRTIKDPELSFSEDSLRILRAIYFAAKLNFKIETNTLNAIIKLKDLVSNLSSVRKTSEMNKILKLDVSKQHIAYKYLLETGVSDNLEVSDAANVLSTSKVHVTDSKIFYSLAFRNKGFVPEDSYQFTRKFITEVNRIIDLSVATEDGDFNTLLLYNYGEEICLYANIVNMILGKNIDLRQSISKNYSELPIKKTCDLVFKGQDVMELCKLEKVSEISVIVDKVKFLVLSKELPNEYEALKNFVLNDFKKGD